jgi:hypothetical protein
MFTRSSRRALLLLVCGALSAASLTAKPSEWSDIQGTRFRGEPTEILGPFALFRTSSGAGKRVFLRGLPGEERLRLYRELAGKSPLAARWSEAQGLATAQVRGHASRVVNKKLQPVSFADVPEPELLLVMVGGNNGEGWLMVENMKPMYHRLERVFHGRIATLFVRVRQTEEEHRRFVVDSGMPWLIADYNAHSSIRAISRLTPSEGSLMLVLSREGTPLLSAVATDLSAVKKFSDDLLELLWAINPENPRSLKDRVQYLSLVRPVEFTESSTGPLLIRNPLLIDGLRRRGVQRISAQVDVAADGSVSAINLKPDAIVPTAVASNLTATLRQHLQFLPAIDHGTAVAGTADYVLNIPADDPVAAADAVWLGGARVELPLSDWLVLRPIRVPESDFGEVDHVDETGKVVMKSMEVSNERVSRKLQINAFNSDWFGLDGAGSVRPAEGDVQTVDEERLVWRKLAAVDGLVDLTSGYGNTDYCVGYAWTEMDVPADIDAWLGIGSDDGLKIWHNGTLVVDRWVRRQSRIDDDIVPLHLKKGKNQLLIKVQNMTIDWSFICRLRTLER